MWQHTAPTERIRNAEASRELQHLEDFTYMKMDLK
jgi:hypothetical protein